MKTLYQQKVELVTSPTSQTQVVLFLIWPHFNWKDPNKRVALAKVDPIIYRSIVRVGHFPTNLADRLLHVNTCKLNQHLCI